MAADKTVGVGSLVRVKDLPSIPSEWRGQLCVVKSMEHSGHWSILISRLHDGVETGAKRMSFDVAEDQPDGVL